MTDHVTDHVIIRFLTLKFACLPHWAYFQFLELIYYFIAIISKCILGTHFKVKVLSVSGKVKSRKILDFLLLACLLMFSMFLISRTYISFYTCLLTTIE